MPLILGANSVTGGYEIDNSLRFDDGSSDFLNRTPASAGNRKTFTFSTWVKRGSLGGNKALFSAEAWPTVPWFQIQFEGEKIRVGVYDTTYEILLVTTPVYRDVSAWYHVVVALDTTQATSSNRVKLYVNGVQVTSFDNEIYPSLNFDTAVNNTVAHYIGDHPALGYYYDGYMAETYLIDGQQLDPTSFGETDEDSGIWKPIAYTGTYGTNGFYLEFKDSSALGDDTSGNSNDFTVNNLTSIDQTTDTPTNNFATWNSLIKTGSTFSNGNLSLASGALPEYEGSMATIVPTQGKWYAEIKVTDAANLQIGFITAQTLIDGNRSVYSSSSNIYWQDNVAYVQYYLNSVSQGNATVTGGTNSTSTYTTNDIIMLAMDLDNGYGWFGKNGTWENSGNPASGTNAFNLASDYADGTTIFTGCLSANVAANFGNPPFTISSGNSDANGYGNFEYAVPSGYYALNTKNLAEYG